MIPFSTHSVMHHAKPNREVYLSSSIPVSPSLPQQPPIQNVHNKPSQWPSKPSPNDNIPHPTPHPTPTHPLNPANHPPDHHRTAPRGPDIHLPRTPRPNQLPPVPTALLDRPDRTLPRRRRDLGVPRRERVCVSGPAGRRACAGVYFAAGSVDLGVCLGGVGCWAVGLGVPRYG